MSRDKKGKLKAQVPHISILDSNLTLEGNIISESNLQINCEVTGDCFTKGKLVISEKAIVEGNIKAKSIYIQGKVIGDIETQEDLVLSSTAMVLGDCMCQSIVVDLGAFLSGKITRTSKDYLDHINNSKPEIELSESVVNERFDVKFTNSHDEDDVITNENASDRLW